MYSTINNQNKENLISASNMSFQEPAKVILDSINPMSSTGFSFPKQLSASKNSRYLKDLKILERPKPEDGEKREFIMNLPQIELAESDEKLLFDIGV